MTPEETRLRQNVLNGSLKAEDYRALCTILCETNRFDESLAVLRDALNLALPDLSRADILTALGCYLNEIVGDTNEPLGLAAQATALLEGLKSPDALAIRAEAQILMAECGWNTDRDRATAAAISALSLIAEISAATPPPEARILCQFHLNAARLNQMLERYENSIQQSKAALGLAHDPVQTRASMTELGHAFHAAGRLAEARETLAAATKVAGAEPYSLVRPFYELGFVERDLGKLPEARAKLQKALEILNQNPALPRVLVNDLLRPVAEISYELGDVKRAAEAYSALIESSSPGDPDYWRAALWLAHCQWELEQMDSARASAEKIVQSPSAPEAERISAKDLLLRVRLARAESLYQAKEFAACIAECDSLLPEFAQGDESYFAAQMLLGHSHLAAGKSSLARAYYEAILASRSASAIVRWPRDAWPRLPADAPPSRNLSPRGDRD